MKWIILLSILFLSTASSAESLMVDVDSSGDYWVKSLVQGWIFHGRVEAPQGVSVVKSTGSDSIGDFDEIQFEPTKTKEQNTSHRYSIKTYQKLKSIIFTEESRGIKAGLLRFPIFDHHPSKNLHQLSFRPVEFAPVILGNQGDAPWIFFSPGGASFIFSPADHFMISNCFSENGTLSAGIESQVNGTPQLFRHKSLLTFGDNVNQAFENWGTTLIKKSKKRFPSNDEDQILNTVGYWSDNRASYWYNYDLSLGYEGTLLAIRDEFLSQGIHLGHLQLDSWWYLKGGDPQKNLPISWKWTNYQHGIYLYQGAPELFPDGLHNFQKSIALPLVTHARWIDPSSPYTKQYKLSNNVSTDPAYWDMIMKSLKANNVLVYEQDWLNSKALPRLDNLSEADQFLDNMSRAASHYGLGLQYCMPLPRHFLQGSRYSNLRTIRTTGDGFERSKWNQFLYGSRLASSLGIWPWTDVFFSADQGNLLIATLSGGIVGVGDRLSQDNNPSGQSNPPYCERSVKCRSLVAQNLKRAIRADGVVVKPDTSLVPTDQSYTKLSGLVEDSPPMVAAAYSNSLDGSHLAAYVFAYAQKQGQDTISIHPGNFGFNTDVYVYNYFTGKGSLVGAHDEILENVGFDGAYFIITPVDESGISLLGDLNLFTSLGKKRIDINQSQIKIHFAPGESNITITAYGPQPGSSGIHAITGTIISTQFDLSSGLVHWKIQRPPNSTLFTRRWHFGITPVRSSIVVAFDSLEVIFRI